MKHLQMNDIYEIEFLEQAHTNSGRILKVYLSRKTDGR